MTNEFQSFFNSLPLEEKKKVVEVIKNKNKELKEVVNELKIMSIESEIENDSINHESGKNNN